CVDCGCDRSALRTPGHPRSGVQALAAAKRHYFARDVRIIDVTTDSTFTTQALACAAALKSAGRLGEAAAVLSDALRDDPTAPAISHELGLIEVEQGNW